MTKFLNADQLEASHPGLVDALAARDVALSNNVGAIIVDGYLGDVLDAIASSSPVATVTEQQIIDWFGSHSSRAISDVLDQGAAIIDGRAQDGVFE
jgi:hypothetical protein